MEPIVIPDHCQYESKALDPRGGEGGKSDHIGRNALQSILESTSSSSTFAARNSIGISLPAIVLCETGPRSYFLETQYAGKLLKGKKTKQMQLFEIGCIVLQGFTRKVVSIRTFQILEFPTRPRLYRGLCR